MKPHLASLFALGAALCAAVLLVACKDPPPPAPEPAAPIVQGGQLRFSPGHPQLALLRSEAAAPPGVVTVELPARVVWNEERTQRVTPAFSGRVAHIEADLGNAVKAGSVLARLISPDFGAAQADAAKARGDAELARKALARQRELFEAGIAARKDAEQAEADALRTAAELQRAEARVAAYGGGGNVDQALVLRAAMPGIVVERNLNPGQELRPDASGPGVPPLFVISDPSSLWVLIDARESEVSTMRPGAEFALVVPTLGERSFKGRIVAVSDSVDPTTRTVKLRGRVDNPDRVLRAEMLANARFERTPGAGVRIPASAVLLRGTGHAVFVQSAPGVFEPRDVRLSLQTSQYALVSAGLEVGDRVVTDNLLLLARQFRLAQDEGTPAAASAASVPRP